MPKRFRKVLVANRGEIAVRVFRACTELGIETTALYSWEDRLSIHRYKADRAYRIGEPGTPVAADLDGEAIVDLALRKGVDAIHLGYGFLSGNAASARRCGEAVSLPIHLRTHDTAPNDVATHMAAAKAGVDAEGCALSRMEGLTRQPSMNALLAPLGGDAPCPPLDPEASEPRTDHWEFLRGRYAPFESWLTAGTTDVCNHGLPEGQDSSPRPRVVHLGLGDRWPEVKRTYQRANQGLGRLIKVTPTRKVGADLASTGRPKADRGLPGSVGESVAAGERLVRIDPGGAGAEAGKPG